MEYGHYTACVRMRTVDVNAARTFLQQKFLDRQKMDKKELIKLVADDLPRERLKHPTHHEHRHDGDKWFEISDTSVHQIHKNVVLQKSAYLLFYERIA